MAAPPEVRPLPPVTEELVRALPKTDLHCHLDGSIRLATVLALAEAQGVRLPADTPEGLARAIHMGETCSSLEDYLTAFDVTLAVLQTEEALYRAALRARAGLRRRERPLPRGALLAGAPHAEGAEAHHHRGRRARGAPPGEARDRHQVERDHLRDPPHGPGDLGAAGRAGGRVQGEGRRRLRPRRRRGGAPGPPPPRRGPAHPRQQRERHHPRGRGVRPRVDRAGGPLVRRAPDRPRGAAARERRPAQLPERPPHPARDVPVVERADRLGDRPGEPTRSSSTSTSGCA